MNYGQGGALQMPPPTWGGRRQGSVTLMSRDGWEPLHALFGGPGALAALGATGYALTAWLAGGIRWQLEQNQALAFLAGAVLLTLFADLIPRFVRVDTVAGTVTTWRSVVLLRGSKQRYLLADFVHIGIESEIVVGSQNGQRTRTRWFTVYLIHREASRQQPHVKRLVVVRTTFQGKAAETAYLLSKLTGLGVDVGLPNLQLVMDSRRARRGMLGMAMMIWGGLALIAITIGFRLPGPLLPLMSLVMPRPLAIVGVLLPATIAAVFVRGTMMVRHGFALPSWATDPPGDPAAGNGRAMWVLAGVGVLAALFATSNRLTMQTSETSSLGGSRYMASTAGTGTYGSSSGSNPGAQGANPYARAAYPNQAGAVPGAATHGNPAQRPASGSAPVPLPVVAAPSAATRLPVEAGIIEIPEAWHCNSGTHTFQGLEITGRTISVTERCTMTLVNCTVTESGTIAAASVSGNGRLTLINARVRGADSNALAVYDRGILTVQGGEIRATTDSAALSAFGRGHAIVTQTHIIGAGTAISASEHGVVTISGTTVEGSAHRMDQGRIANGANNTGLTVQRL